jgi:chemotaxis protein methyltransferase CheR
MRELSAACGFDLGTYRAEHVRDCMLRAREREEVKGAAELAELVRMDPRARDRLRRSVAVSVTGMFRDPDQFDLLEERLPELAAAANPRISVWSAGCATGAELLSVGVLLERHGLLDDARLLGSDLLEENVAMARDGGPEPLGVSEAVRVRARWEVRDLVADGPPAGAWTLILCRNVAIYMNRTAKTALYDGLAGALARGGMLMLGRSESLLQSGLERVAPRIYRRPL